jgi:hypothetical protein
VPAPPLRDPSLAGYPLGSGSVRLGWQGLPASASRPGGDIGSDLASALGAMEGRPWQEFAQTCHGERRHANKDSPMTRALSPPLQLDNRTPTQFSAIFWTSQPDTNRTLEPESEQLTSQPWTGWTEVESGCSFRLRF